MLVWAVLFCIVLMFVVLLCVDAGVGLVWFGVGLAVGLVLVLVCWCWLVLACFVLLMCCLC